MNEFQKAPIVMESGIPNPDEFTWECDCETCKVRYETWKFAYELQQKDLRGEA